LETSGEANHGPREKNRTRSGLGRTKLVSEPQKISAKKRGPKSDFAKRGAVVINPATHSNGSASKEKEQRNTKKKDICIAPKKRESETTS